MDLLSVPSVSSRYFNKIKRTSYLGKLPALSLEILSVDWMLWASLKGLGSLGCFSGRDVLVTLKGPGSLGCFSGLNHLC